MGNDVYVHFDIQGEHYDNGEIRGTSTGRVWSTDLGRRWGYGILPYY